MWQRIISGLMGMLFCATACAQHQIQVRVQSKEENIPIPAAYVHLLGPEGQQPVHTVLADGDGLAQLTVDSLPVRIEVTSLGYQPATVLVRHTDKPVLIILTKRFSALDEFVVTGTAAPIRLQDALSTYQVITKAAMQAQGAVTVKDALKNQININMGNDNLLGSRTSMQGMTGDKVKILIDGMPVNGREMGEIDLGQINLNNVQKIEIVQGPMSVVYGTDALGGVINIITRKDHASRRIEAGVYYESIGHYNADVSGSYNINKRHQVTVGGGRNFFRGWKHLDTLLERSYLWKPKEQYFGNLAYNYTAKSSFRLQFATDLVKEKVTNKDPYYKITPFEAYGFDDYYRSTRLMSRLLMSGDLGKGKWQLQNGYGLYYRTRNMYRIDLTTLDKELVQNGSHDTSRFDDVNLRGNYSNSLAKLSYTIGYDINLQNGSSTKIGPDGRRLNDYAAYLSTTIPISKQKLDLQPALRYAYNTAYNAPLIPSMNLLYKVRPDVQLRLSYARGFRAPSLKELYLRFIDINHEVIGNPDLKAEHGHHLQASASWTAYRKDENFLRFLLTGYHNDVSNQITLFQPDPNELYATYVNVGRMKNVLGTIQADGQWKNLYFQLGYTRTELLDQEEAAVPSSSQATLTLQYGLPRFGVSVASFFKYFGEQPRLVADIDGGFTYNGVIAPYSFWDASIEKKLFKNRVQLIAGVKNLLDIQTSNVAGATSGGVHTGSAGGGENIATGRSVFTSLRLTLQ